MKTKILISTLLLSIFFATDILSQDDYVAQIESIRAAKNQEFKTPGTSPLSATQLSKFTSLSYFPVDGSGKIQAVFTPDETKKEVSLNTSAGGNLKLIKHGTLTFKIAEKTYKMDVFQNKDLPEFGSNKGQLFIPFKDVSSGKETNTTGRYLPIILPASGNTVVLDFNKAQNPYNAYNPKLVSIVPPPANIILSAMTTGERKYEDRSQ